MANVTSTPPSSAAPASSAICPGCGKAVDPLRAGHVAILDGAFAYFCNAECKQSRFRGPASTLSPDEIETAAPPEVVVLGAPAQSTPTPSSAKKKNGTNGNGVHANGNGVHANGNGVHAKTPSVRAPQIAYVDIDAPVSSGTREAEAVQGRADARARTRLEQGPRTLRSPAEIEAARTPELAPIVDVETSPRSAPRARSVDARARGAVVRGAYYVGIAAGALVPAVGLIDSLAATARLPLVGLAATALLVRVALAERDPSEPHPIVALAAALGAAAAAYWAAYRHDSRAAGIAILAGVAAASLLAIDMLIERAKARVVANREHIARSLDVKVRVLYGEEPVTIAPWDVKPGEQVVVETGEVIGVDAIVSAGSATVTPWLDAPVDVTKREGDAVVAGARVVSGSLRLTTTWAGLDRAWAKLALSPTLRVDVAAPIARATRLTMERGAPLVAALVAVAAFANGVSPVEVFAAACAAALAFGAKGVSAVVALHHARAHATALASGIVYKDARAFERAGTIDVAVLCARGTVLMGEPEIVAIEPLGSGDVGRVLALAAGAEQASSHPFASAILRAARTRGERPDNVRNAAVHAGLGVTALAASGDRLVVGSRALMMQEKISVALADTRVTELEAQGRSVLLVSLADKVVGLIALQDGMRAGARAAVQRLLDAKVEPILLSGEARETCQSIARSLDIEHIRPEVLPAERGTDVRSLADVGHIVAVIGHPSTDDGALGASDVAVAMSAAGQTPGEWGVALASDDVRDAAQALTVPHVTRERVRTALIIGFIPGAVALLAISFGILPLAVAPLSALIGAIAALTYTRETA